MAAAELRRRPQPSSDSLFKSEPISAAPTTSDDTSEIAHPSGREKKSRLTQFVRGFSFVAYFVLCCVAINITQFVGAPLYWINRDLYYAYMALTKESFGLLIVTMTKVWGPTTIRISGDESVAGEITRAPDGRVEFDFPDRMVMIANHQIYTDWLYLWWVGYANNPQMHGYLYIILKESLKFIPVIGPGMMFYGFIFMSRKMSVDQPRMAYRLGKLKMKHTAPNGSSFLNPMWLLLFPEGTNLSDNGRVKSAKWAAKAGIKDCAHLLLPRSTGMYFVLKELKGTVEYVYDCTVAYEGIPRGGYGEELFTLSGTYFQGQPPKSVNLFWRKFRVADIPLDDHDSFDAWVLQRWYEKDALMETYVKTGRFPPMSAGPEQAKTDAIDYIETEVRTKYWWEFLRIFVVVGIFGLLGNIVLRIWHTSSRILR
ncbi:acyltransferase-domain-containing protein [Coniella lustricola]|uniref:Acyltransferase-domain-containing protein n=1 Tax=Coniella lustricola TaxID=2025994 RepID=A0A2T3A4F4_9PEZI|nr:acyltransferase-domain-containing protein [Coniella lustricola]